MSENTILSPSDRVKSLRVFAGPPGSGKTSTYRAIVAHHNLGVYVNADDLQNELATPQGLLLRRFHPSLDDKDLRAFYARHPLRLSFGGEFPFSLSSEGKLNLIPTAQTSQRAGYAAAVIADYVRTRLIEADASLACETVLADPSELALFRRAKEKAYRIFLYFICVASPVISKQRVAIRVKHGGLALSEAKIVEDYDHSLANLKEAVALSDRAYLFDNTYSGAALKLEIRQASDVIAHETQLPEWLTRNLPPLVPRA